MSSLQARLYTHRKRRRRNVYVIARPLDIATRFSLSFLSEGKLPLCHWGILVSNHGHDKIIRRWEAASQGESLNTNLALGTVFELRRTVENLNTVQTIKDFGRRELNSEWQVMTIKYVGKTSFSVGALEKRANKITELYPCYHGYTNNCQNFVRYLLHFACPGRDVPKTIQGTVTEVLTYFQSPGIVANAIHSSSRMLFVSTVRRFHFGLARKVFDERRSMTLRRATSITKGHDAKFVSQTKQSSLPTRASCVLVVFLG